MENPVDQGVQISAVLYGPHNHSPGVKFETYVAVVGPPHPH